MNNNRTNTLLLTVIGVATLLVAVIGASFAYFTAQLSGEEHGDTVTIGAGVLSIAYADGDDNVIKAEGVVPIGTEEELIPIINKEFTITGNNNTTAIMPYTISLKITTNEFTTGALRYTFESSNNGGNGVVPPSVTVPQNISTGDDQTINLGDAHFNGNVTNSVHSYTLKIYFPDTLVNQDEDKSKAFSGKVDIGVQEIINQ